MTRSPLFADVALAARIEAAERDYVAGCVRACPSPARVLPLAGGVALWAGDGSPLNKVAGLGFAPFDAAAEAALAEHERALAERGAAVQVEVATLAAPALAELLCRRGYALVGFENVLGRRLDDLDDLDDLDPDGAAPRDAAALAVTRAAPDDDAWLEAAVAGFTAPDDADLPAHEVFDAASLRAVFRDTSRAAGTRRYLARRGDVIVGSAAARLHADARVAQLSGASTLPAHRRRGVQTALLRARLRDAAAAGCELAVVTALPGSRSQLNIQRQGFALLYARALLVRAAPTR
ncbi:MAG: GNAT family N-acetyltransferase [Nannocystaceae bacterium]